MKEKNRQGRNFVNPPEEFTPGTYPVTTLSKLKQMKNFHAQNVNKILIVKPMLQSI